jgi:hypothetical protein
MAKSSNAKNERRQQESSSTSTHSRIVQGTGSTTKEWTSRDEAAGKGSFASHLRESSSTSTGIHSKPNAMTVHHAEVVDMKSDSHCPLHTHSAMHSKSSGGQSNSRLTSAVAFSHNQHQQSNSMNRTSKVVQNDNLGLSKGNFDGQTSSRSSYGGHYQMTDRVVPVRSTQQSSISLGSYNIGGSGSSYKKEFTRQEIKPCPASLLETSKSPYKYQRQSSSHRFYMPTVSD